MSICSLRTCDEYISQALHPLERSRGVCISAVRAQGVAACSHSAQAAARYCSVRTQVTCTCCDAVTGTVARLEVQAQSCSMVVRLLATARACDLGTACATKHGPYCDALRSKAQPACAVELKANGTGLRCHACSYKYNVTRKVRLDPH